MLKNVKIKKGKSKKPKSVKFCPSCGKKWDGIECKHCSFDIEFDPYYDLG